MGHVWVDVKLINPITGQDVKLRALVGAGATFTIVPLEIHEKLNFKIVGKKRVETAKGYLDLDESFALLEVCGKKGVTPILISKELKDVLIGVLTLEALGLTVDPTTGELKEARILLL
jgi:predicted aspartyl protease